MTTLEQLKTKRQETKRNGGSATSDYLTRLEKKVKSNEPVSDSDRKGVENDLIDLSESFSHFEIDFPIEARRVKEIVGNWTGIRTPEEISKLASRIYDNVNFGFVRKEGRPSYIVESLQQALAFGICFKECYRNLERIESKEATVVGICKKTREALKINHPMIAQWIKEKNFNNTRAAANVFSNMLAPQQKDSGRLVGREEGGLKIGDFTVNKIEDVLTRDPIFNGGASQFDVIDDLGSHLNPVTKKALDWAIQILCLSNGYLVDEKDKKKWMILTKDMDIWTAKQIIENLRNKMIAEDERREREVGNADYEKVDLLDMLVEARLVYETKKHQK